MFATYVHDMNPVIFKISDSIALRWYGLAYLAAFVVAVLLLNHLSKRKLWVLPPGSAGDFIAAAAIFGVFIGGRLGYVFGYLNGGMFNPDWLSHLTSFGFLRGAPAPEAPFLNPEWVELMMSDPAIVVRVWEGGMASHGGILGLVILTWFYSRKKKVSWTGLGDGLCVVAPLGLMFGRFANFINGELYGRAADGVAWAVKFPNTLIDTRLTEHANFDLAVRAAIEADEGFRRWYAGLGDFRVSEGVILEQLKLAQRANPAVSEAIAPFLEARHPSQLYQAFGEGLALFLILWFLRVRCPKLPHGVLTGVFFIGYALFRILGEQFRQPDSAMVGLLTKGQFFSLFMILGGAAFIVVALRKGRGLSAES